MNKKLKHLLLSVLKFAVPLGIVGYLLLKIEPEQWQQLQSSDRNYGYLALALVFGLSGTLISYVRWWLLVKTHDIPLTVAEVVRISAIGYLLGFASVGVMGGDFFKAYFLARRKPGKRIEVFSTVVVDRIIGLYGLVVVASIALLMIGSELALKDGAWIRTVVFGLTILGAVAMLGLVTGGRAIDWMLDRLSHLALVGPFVHRVADPLRAFRHHTGVFLFAIAMSIVVHVAMSIAIFFVASGLYDNHPSLGDHLVMVPVANAVAGLPIAPGGVGVFEAVLDQGYKKLPAVPTDASGTIVGLAFEIVKIIICFMGVVFYWTGGKEMHDTVHQAEEELLADQDDD